MSLSLFATVFFSADASSTSHTEEIVRVLKETATALPKWLAVYAVVPAPAHLHSTDFWSVLSDVTGRLHQLYGARSACFYLIRPDNFVALRYQGSDLSPVIQYFQKLTVNWRQA